MDSSYSELRKNTLIIAIASLGSKLIAFALAPFYSHFIDTANYGMMDLIVSTIGLLVPILCLDVFEATFRFSNERDYDKQSVLSSSIIISIPGMLLCFIAPLFSGVIDIDRTSLFMLSACFAVEIFDFVVAQYLRGIKKMVLFAFFGVSESAGLLFANIFFLYLFRWGLKGWIISFLISKVTGMIYLLIVSDFCRAFSFKKWKRSYAKEFMRFCLPLMPTAIMWWIMNLSDRYMLAFYLGVSTTGIYGAASKIPSMMSAFENIFYQAWMTTAIQTKDSRERNKLYSDVFNKYFTILMICFLGVLFIGKPCIGLFEDSYSEAYIYIPVLTFGVVLHALNGNLGSLYSVFKNTKGALYSALIGAATNVVLNCFFIPIFGIMGAAITTLIGYAVTLIYRWFDTKSFLSIQLNIKQIVVLTLAGFGQIGLYYISELWSLCVMGVVLITVCCVYRKLLLSIVKRT